MRWSCIWSERWGCKVNIRAEDLVDAVTEELDIYASEVADTVKKP